MKKLFFISVILSLFHHSHAQIIRTIAGNGVAGYTGDGGPATAAQIRGPRDLLFDAVGNLLIADIQNYRIRKISTSGIITTIAGTGVSGYNGDGIPATDAQISEPHEMAYDGAGNLYFSDPGNQRVRKIDPSGIISTVVGNGISGFGGDGGPATAAVLSYPSGICIDHFGNLYIGDGNNYRIRKVNTSGIISTYAGTGVWGFSGDGGPASSANFKDLYSMVADTTGNIILADYGNNRIRKIDHTTSIINTIAGNGSAIFSGDGGPALFAGIQPFIITIDSTGNIYIGGDAYRARKIDNTGLITSIAGNGTYGYTGDNCLATSAALYAPYGVIADNAGNIFIADFGNHVIREIVPSHNPSFAGGHLQVVAVCEGPVDSVNTLLAISDADTAQTETWSVLAAPAHGALTASYVATSSLGLLTPTGLYYAPVAGYTGPDTFKVVVTDCGNLSDTTTICLTIQAPLTVSAISGHDTVCISDTIILADASPGGFWTISNANALLSSGVVTGVSSGYDTISYTVTNSCGPVTATHPVFVRPCPTLSVPGSGIGNDLLQLWPSPNYGTFKLSVATKVNEQIKLTITNMLGQQVKDIYINSNSVEEITLDTPPGVYFISANTGRQILTARMVIQ